MNAARIAHDYWITMRPYLCFVTGSAALAGIALAPSASNSSRVLAFGALFFSYGLGQALTDVFQVDTDSLSAPYRPLVRGSLSRATVLLLSFAGLLGMGVVLAWLNPVTAFLVIAGVGGLATYTWFKRRFWAGPTWNSWIMALIPIMGFLAAGGVAAQASLRLALVAGVTFSSYAVFVLLGYFKDIDADRATGYETLPVRHGRRISVVVSAVSGVVALVCVAGVLTIVPVPPPAAAVIALAFVLAGCLFTLRAHARMWSVETDAAAHPAIGDSVRAFVNLHLGLAVWLQPGFLAAAPVLVVLFEIALASRPERSQI